MRVFIDKGEKIKINNITFDGNSALPSTKLRGSMSKTKKKFLGRFWKSSKYIEENFREDLEKILERYSRLGFRDARILSDSISWNSNNTINIHIKLEEESNIALGILFT